MIVVDTSVWISYFRSGTAKTTAHLHALLDGDDVALVAPVRLELLAGVRRAELTRLRRVLSALPLWMPTDRTWATMEAWVERTGTRGHRFGVGDLLIGAMAAEHGAPVWSLDADYARMGSLGLVSLHVP